MDALELALHCSSLLMRTMTKELRESSTDTLVTNQNDSMSYTSTLCQQMDESDCERPFQTLRVSFVFCGQLVRSK